MDLEDRAAVLVNLFQSGLRDEAQLLAVLQCKDRRAA
jgi:hypothetical protein